MTQSSNMWGGRFSEGPSALLRALNDSFHFDRELLAEDVEGSIAWAREIAQAGVLTAEEADAVVAALSRVAAPELLVAGGWLSEADGLDDSRQGTPRPGDQPQTTSNQQPATNYEDVHSYVESQLREQVGPLAGKLHTGRSRNDQVATDLRLWLKKACDDFDALARALARTLAQKALEESATAMPGYTHLKQAEPVTFGHWCMAYVEMLRRDLSRIADAKNRGDECPLGSAALAGTPLNIDRERLAHSLGFARATRNSLDAVSDRDL
ncbi:MAG: lyase family protein, partial [Acidobacteriota bacterium]